MIILRNFFILALMLLVQLPINANANVRPDSLLLKVFAYSNSEQEQNKHIGKQYTYNKFRLNVVRRNLALLPVPTMYAVAHSGRRVHLLETISRETTDSLHSIIEPQLTVTTFPHHRQAMEVASQYLNVNIFGETMMGNALLSPFNEKNKRYYRYTINEINEQQSILIFKGKIDNTQLVVGNATVDNRSGQILSSFFWGDYDMLRFKVNIKIKPDSAHTDIIQEAELASAFNFLGNKLTSFAYSTNIQPCPELDTLQRKDDLWLMESYRPIQIPQNEQNLLNQVYDVNGLPRHEESKGFKRFMRKILWNSIGDNLVNRIKTNFGANQEGYFRLNPLLNPLYLGYSGKKGLYYKYDLRANYNFSTNQQATLRLKGGYSFKQKQFYFNVPFLFFFNKRHNGYLKFEVKNGTWIKNGELAQKAIEALPNDYPIDTEKATFFKVLNWSLTVNHNLSKHFSLEVGILNHNRRAVERSLYKDAGQPSSYHTAGPVVELQYRPWGWSGPIIIADYERSIKGMLRSSMAFERWEFDAQYLHRISVMRSISYRAGCGFYTMKDKVPYFIEFSNFYENNIPGGWRDDWSGEFELLHQDYYYNSKYYIRSNVTYESPLMLLSRIPFVGRMLETERIYGSLLCVKHLWPYAEFGYGFTNKFLSMGIFVSAHEAKFHGIGFKFGFELFRDW